MIDKALARLLADGVFHSGQMLGDELHLSRGAVWNRIRALREAGIPVHSVPGRGYRIPGGLDLLDADVIRRRLPGDVVSGLDVLDVRHVVDSTNEVVMSSLRQGGMSRIAVLAEQQTAGRGRRGRAWASPYAANLYLSLSREFLGGLAAVDGLSLAVGVALCDAAVALGVTSAGLKWPNDLVAGGKKLGGILIEISGEATGSCVAVIGVGLNVAMSLRSDIVIDQPWTDLRREGMPDTSRNEIAATVLEHVLRALDAFSRLGLAGFADRWRRYDVILGRPVDVLVGSARISGVAAGIDAGGALIVNTDDGPRIFHGGEVSVRGSA